MNQPVFNEAHVLHELKHYLPSQTPLKDFIHHNSLHAFQHLKFYDAIFRASKIFGYQVTLQLAEFRNLYKNGRIKDEILDEVLINRKGAKANAWKTNLVSKSYDDHNEPRIGRLRAQWKQKYPVDLDNLVQPILFRVLCSYLDQGIAIWDFPLNKDGFLASVKELEHNSFTSLFKTQKARNLLSDKNK